MRRLDRASKQTMARIHQIIDCAPVISTMKFGMHDRRTPNKLAQRSNYRDFRPLGIDLDQIEGRNTQAAYEGTGVPKLDRNRYSACVGVSGSRTDHGILRGVERHLTITVVQPHLVDDTVSNDGSILRQKAEGTWIGLHAVDDRIRIRQSKIPSGKPDVCADVEHGPRGGDARHRLIALVFEDLFGDVSHPFSVRDGQIDPAILRSRRERHDGGSLVARLRFDRWIPFHRNTRSVPQPATAARGQCAT